MHSLAPTVTRPALSQAFSKAAALLALICALVLYGCGKPLTRDECNRLLDRYVELLVVSDRPGTSAEELLRLKQEARIKAAQDPAFGSCSSEVSRSAFDCAMLAPTADRLEQCML